MLIIAVFSLLLMINATSLANAETDPKRFECLKTTVTYSGLIAFSENNEWLASGSDDNTIKIYYTSDWREIRTLSGHNENVESLAFSKNNDWLASCSSTGSPDYKGIIKIWNTSNWSEIISINEHPSKVKSVAFSENNDWLASSDSDATIKIWNTSDWSEIKSLNGQSGAVESVTFSPNNEWLASGSSDNLKIWNTSDWSEIKTLTGHSSGVESIAFSENNQWLASGSFDNTIKIWDTSDWSEIKTLTGHSQWVRDIDFSENNQWLASSSDDNTIKIWDTSDWNEMKTLTSQSTGVWSIDFSTNNKWLASSSYHETMNIWDIVDWNEIKTFSGHSGGVESIAFSENNKWLASGSSDFTIKIWDIVDWNCIKILTGHYNDVYVVDFSENNEWLASVSYDEIIIWDTSNWSEMKTLTGHSDDIHSIDFSENNEWLASGSRDKTIKIWNTSDWSEIKTLTGHYSSVNSVTFSNNNEWLASGSYDDEDNSIKIWNTSDWSETITLTGSPLVECVAFSENNKWLASGGMFTYITIWNTSDWSEIKTLTGEEGVIVTFSENNEWLASCSGSKSIKIWDTSDWSEIKTLTGHSKRVQSVAFSKNNQLLVSGSEDDTIKIWGNVPELTLKSSNITFSKENIISSETVTIYAEIENIGLINVTNVKINFYDNLTLIGSDSIDLLAGETNTLSIEWIVSSIIGSHTIYIKIDEKNIINEENETNNNASIDIKITLKPIATIDLIYPDIIIEGNIINFYGNGTDDGTIEGYNWISNINGFLSSEKSFSLSNLSVGTHTISFKVKDDFGVWSEIVNETLIINPNQKPTANFSSLTNGSEIDKSKKTFTIKGTSSDDEEVIKIQIKIDNEEWQDAIGTTTWTYEWDISKVNEGKHTIDIRAFDGNIYSEIEKIDVFIIKEDEIKYDVKLSLGEEVNVKPGKEHNFKISVKNNGTTQVHISFKLKHDLEEWTFVKLDDVLLNVNKTEDIILSFSVPKNTKEGDYKIVIVATIKNNPTITEELEVTIHVEKEKIDGGDSNNFIIILSISGIVAIIGIIGFVIFKKRSSEFETPQQPQFQTQQMQYQRIPPSPTQQTQNINYDQKQTCPFCNAQVPVQFKFCNMCGKQIKN